MVIKYIVWSFLVVFFAFLVPFATFHLVGSFCEFAKSFSFVYSTNQANINLAINRPSLSLLFVGDIMLSRGVEDSVLENNNGDFSYLFKKTGFIKKADVAFANLEGPVSDKGRSSGGLYSFRFQLSAFNALVDAGFDVLSVANNHAADWGSDAFEENLFRLKNEQIIPIGGGTNKKDASIARIVEKNNIKIGFLGFSDVGPDWFEAKESRAGILIVNDDFSFLVNKASEKVDVLVVSLHFGEEYQKVSNERQKRLARLAIDSGARIVVGHHPHVIQEVENYKEGVIAYSLGNFIFDQNFSEETMEGLALEIYLEGSDIAAVKKNKIKLNQFFQPELID